jgi:mannonate dehydratase
LYQKLIDLNPNPSNKLELCLGSLQEMESDKPIYDYLEQYLAQDRVSYIHFRNVKGKVPCYDEVFVDEGDIDMFRVLKILKNYKFNGVLIPDHTPLMTCGAPWHAGMAYALGFMKAAFGMLDINND